MLGAEPRDSAAIGLAEHRLEPLPAGAAPLHEDLLAHRPTLSQDRRRAFTQVARWCLGSMERTVEIATGESVAFSYELAGIGSRFFAVAIDMSIQFGVALLTFIVLAILAATPLVARGPSPPLTKIESAIVTGVLIAAAFVLFFGYFIVFEWLWHGRTPGKRAVGLRVVRDGGFPLDFATSVIRNTVRLLEAGLGLYAVSAIVMLLSPRNRRLGDYAAGTLVVRDNRYERSDAPTPADYDAARRAPQTLAAPLRSLVARYVARRDSLDERARPAVAADIAAAVRPHLEADFAYLNDDDLLLHLARTMLV